MSGCLRMPWPFFSQMTARIAGMILDEERPKVDRGDQARTAHGPRISICLGLMEGRAGIFQIAKDCMPSVVIIERSILSRFAYRARP